MNRYLIAEPRTARLLAPVAFFYEVAAALDGYNDACELAGMLGGIVTTENWLMRRVPKQPKLQILRRRSEWLDYRAKLMAGKMTER